jgi:glycosyltransferase involved in cell wall biosynthesis
MRDALRALGHKVMILGGVHVEYFDGSIEELPIPSLWHRLRGRRFKDGFELILNPFHVAKRCGAQVFEIEESFGFAGRLRGLPIVTRLHGPNAFNPDAFDPRREAAEVASLQQVRAVSSPSAALLDAIRQRYGLELAHARVIPNPIELASERWRIDEADPNQIIFVGRFDMCKGSDIAIRAFAKARNQRPNLRMVMVGPGAFPRNLPPGVTLLGAQSPERITELRMQSMLALSCSRSEAFSYVVAEAMALGMPVLATNTFGPSEIIRDGTDGRLVSVGDVDATVKVMVEMLSEPTTLAQLGQAAALRVGEYMSPTRIAAQTANLYSEVIGRRG